MDGIKEIKNLEWNIWRKVKNINDNKFKFLLIARLLKDKGIIEFIEAIKIVKNKYENIEFQISAHLNLPS